MNTKVIKLSMLALTTLLAINVYGQSNSLKLEGPYMGQTPPGLVAEPFAPGIISKAGWQLEGVFSPDLNEFYYTSRINKVITVTGYRQENNVWQQFTQFKRRGEVSFTPDGKRMLMAKGYKERVGNEWSKRKSLGPQIDKKEWGIMRLSASSNDTYVFDDARGGDVIRISTVNDGVRQPATKMNSEINRGKWTAHPFIAPDESYIIWDSEREEGYGDSDLYISFKQADGTWGKAINMGPEVNSSKWDAFATVTSDGKYMLFNRSVNEETDDTDIYWVDARIIEKLKKLQ